MAYSIFEETSYGKVDLLSERLRRQQWFGNLFGAFVAPNFVKIMKGEEVTSFGLGDDGIPKFSGAPVEIFEDFVRNGQIDMRIPVKQRLTEMPIHGDKPLKGQEERQSITWRTVRINRTRKATSQPTGMSRQTIKKIADKLIEEAEQTLRTYFGNDYHPGNFILATVLGGSRDLLVPSALGGRAITSVSHPNFLVAGSGFVSYAGGRPGVAGYEASVEADVDGLSNTASDFFSVNLVKNAVIEAPRRRIGAIVFQSGFHFYPLFCSDAQWAQLQADPDFKEWMRRLPEQLQKHPLANGAVAYVHGAVIYPDLKMWGIRTNASDAAVTAGTVEYGPAPTAAERSSGVKFGNWIKNLDTNNRKVAILMGASALSVGVGERLAIKEDVEDYENVKGIGIDTIQSVVRNDIYDQDGQTGLTAGQFQENTSSMLIATYSPQNLSYV